MMVYIETGCKMGDRTYLVPDVSITYLRRARAKYQEGAPALAIEVISESSTAEDMDQMVPGLELDLERIFHANPLG